MLKKVQRDICKSIFATGIIMASAITAQAQVLGVPSEINDQSLTTFNAQSVLDPLQLKQVGPIVQKGNYYKIDAVQADGQQVVASVYHNGRVKKIKYRNHDRRHHNLERGHRHERHHEEGERHHRGRHRSS